MNLFEQYASDIKKHNSPISSTLIEEMGNQLSKISYSLLPEDYDQPAGVRNEELLTRFPQALGQPIDNSVYRRMVINAIDDASVDETGAPMKASPEAIHRMASNEAVLGTFDARGINRADFEVAYKLAQPGATVKDLFQEYGKSMIYPATIFGSEQEKTHNADIVETTQAAWMGGVNAALTHSPDRKGFWNYAAYQMKNAVTDNSRSARTVFRDYGGSYRINRDRAVESLFNVFRDQVGSGEDASEIQRWATNLIDENPKLISDYGRDSAGNLAQSTETKWDYLQRYVNQHGSIPMSGAPLRKGETVTGPLSMDSDLFQKVRSRLEGTSRKQIAEKLKESPKYSPARDKYTKRLRLFDSVQNTYDGLRAGGFGSDSESTYNQQALTDLSGQRGDEFGSMDLAVADELIQGSNKQLVGGRSEAYFNRVRQIANLIEDSEFREEFLRQNTPLNFEKTVEYAPKSRAELIRGIRKSYKNPYIASKIYPVERGDKPGFSKEPTFHTTKRYLTDESADSRIGDVFPSQKQPTNTKGDALIDETSPIQQPNPTSDSPRSTGLSSDFIKNNPELASLYGITTTQLYEMGAIDLQEARMRLTRQGSYSHGILEKEELDDYNAEQRKIVRNNPLPDDNVAPVVIPASAASSEPDPIPSRTAIPSRSVAVAGAGEANEQPQNQTARLSSITGRALARQMGLPGVDTDNPARLMKGLNYASHDQIVASPSNKLILGFAGTGKTQVLARTAQKALQDGAKPGEVLALFGTRKAKESFNQRLATGDFGTDVANIESTYTASSLALTAMTRLSGRHGIPFDFGSNPDMNYVVDPYDLTERVSSAMSSSGMYSVRDQNGRIRPGAGKVVGKHQKALEHMVVEGHTPADMEKEGDVRNYYTDEMKVDPKAVSFLYDNVYKPIQQSGRVIIPEMIKKATDIFEKHPEAAQEALGGRYKQLLIDEANQYNESETRLFEAIKNSNPGLKITAVADSLQAAMWDFKGGGEENLAKMAEALKLNVVGLSKNYRLGEGAIQFGGDLFGMGHDELPVPEGGWSGRSKNSAVRSFLDVNVGNGPEDTKRALLESVKAKIESGEDPGSIAIQTWTNRQREEIDSLAESMGVPSSTKVDRDKLQSLVAEGRIGAEEARKIEGAGGYVPGTVRIATTHGEQSGETKHNYLLGSQDDYPENNSRQKYESRSRMYTAATRTKKGGQLHIFSDKQRGGVPDHVKQYDPDYSMTKSARQASTKELQGEEALRGQPVFTKDPESAMGFYKSITGQLPQSKKVNPGNLSSEETSILSFSAGSAAFEAFNAVRSGQLKNQAGKVHEYVMRAIDTTIDSMGERLQEQIKDPGQLQSRMGELRAAGEKIVDASLGNYGIGSGGSPPIIPTRVSPGTPGYRSGMERSNASSQAGGYSWYKMARGLWAAKMAGSAIQQAFSGPMNEAKAYGRYQSNYAPFAAMAGELDEGSPQAYALQQDQARRAMAQGSYQQWGGFTELFAESAVNGGSLPRLAAGLKPAGSLLMAGGQASIASSLMGAQMTAMGSTAMGGFFTAAAPVVFGGAAAAASGLALGTVGMELYNQNIKPEGETPMTWSKLFVSEQRKSDAINTVMPDAKIAYAEKLGITVGQLDQRLQAEKDEGSGWVMNMMNTFSGTPGGSWANPVYSEGGLNDKLEDYAWEEHASERFPSVYGEFNEIDSLAKQVQSVSEEIAMNAGQDPSQSDPVIMNMLQEMTGERSDILDVAKAIGIKGGELGMGMGLYPALGSMAKSKGLLPGTDGYTSNVSSGVDQYDDAQDLLQARDQATHTGQLGSQLNQYFSKPGFGQQLASTLGITTQAQASTVASVISTSQIYGVDQSTSAALGTSALGDSPYRANWITQGAKTWGEAGLDVDQFYGAFLNNKNLSDEEARLLPGLAGYDLGAISYAHRNDLYGGAFSDPKYNFQNEYGEPVGTRSGMDWLAFTQANDLIPQTPIKGISNINNTAMGMSQSGYWQGTQGQVAGSPITPVQAFQDFFGHSSMPEGYYDAWAQGGSMGAQAFVRGKQADYQLAGIGVQMQQLNANRNFYWGSKSGGTWDNPASDSMWGMQDQMRDLQYGSQMATFESRERQMGIQWAYTAQSNALTQQQMNLSRQGMNTRNDYQMWSMDFGRQQSLTQRQWTMEDWGYQDTMSSLGYEWNMEDYEEAIRGSTGRERRNLLKKRERTTTQYNLEQEQTETQRGRQEEVWAVEDERFGKQKEYQEELMELEEAGMELQEQRFNLSKSYQTQLRALEIEDFERAKEEYEEQHELEEKMTELQREHQDEMMELQEKAMGISAASAALSKQSAEDQLEYSKKIEDWTKQIKENNTYGPAKTTMELFGDLIDTIRLSNPHEIENVQGAVEAFGAAGVGSSAQMVTDMLRVLSNISPTAIQALINLLYELD